jgi:hypothetical protein
MKIISIQEEEIMIQLKDKHDRKNKREEYDLVNK